MSDTNDWNRQIIEEFRANNGKVGGTFENIPLLILHTTGAKSGQPRANPLVYVMDGDRYVIVASKGGAPTNPAWYYNLVANPVVCVEVGTERFDAVATVAEGSERTRLFDLVSAQSPFFGDYARKTTRVIPVIILTRQAE
jgi:deazaflavin-dependent oxidoreductase (nitroreductase family)